MPSSKLFPLPFDPTPPTRDEVIRAATASPLVASLVRLRSRIGDHGVALNGRRGFTLAPAVTHEILDDESLPDDDGMPRYVDPRQRMQLLVAVGVECGALDDTGDRLVPCPTWEDDDAVVVADAALDAVFDLGPMSTGSPFVNDPTTLIREATLDANCVAWLAQLLPDGRSLPVDHFVNNASDLFREHFAGDPFPLEGEFDTWVNAGLCRLVSTLAWAGAIEWTDREVRSTPLHGGVTWIGGGTICLTALGRLVLPDRLAEVGLCIRERCDRPVQPADTLLGDLMMTDHDDRPAMIAAWQPTWSDDRKARALCQVLLDGPVVPLQTAAAFEALALLGPEIAAPFVRELLDSPVAQHAAYFLDIHRLVDWEQLSGFAGLEPLILSLAALVSRPDELRDAVVDTLERVPEPVMLLEAIALHRAEVATMLLTAAARHVTDPRFTGMLRAAEVYHHCVLDDIDPDELIEAASHELN